MTNNKGKLRPTYLFYAITLLIFGLTIASNWTIVSCFPYTGSQPQLRTEELAKSIAENDRIRHSEEHQIRNFDDYGTLPFFSDVGIDPSNNSCGGACRNGGYCNETLETCMCDTYFTPESRCYNLSCSANGAHRMDSNFCNCTQGWGGSYCTSCKNESVCYEKYKDLLHHTNGTFVCDKTLMSYGQLDTKVFDCMVKKEGIWSAIGDMNAVWYCPNMINGTSNHCQLQLYTTTGQRWGPWHKPAGNNYEIFSCTGNDCSQEAGTNQKGESVVDYQCRTTNCSCSGEYPCPDLLKNFLAIMKGKAWFKCNDNTTWCTFEQEQLKFLMSVNCTASECILNPSPIPPIPPPKPFNYAAVAITAAVLSSVVFLLVLSTTIHYIYSRIKNKSLYMMWKEMNKNDNFDFSFYNISYCISKYGPFGKKQYILQNISAHVPQGKLMAIMGASGAGKSSLLDILAGRVKSGQVTGDICVGGVPIDSSYQLIKGYVLQENIMLETMTVHEYVMFSAELRLPQYVSHEKKLERVRSVLRELRISHLANQRIGSNIQRGLSGGEKRRVAIAAELVVSKPIIFCDEPTSGLDSYNAYEVMSSLHNLAQSQNKTIIVSIHQPSSSIFSLIDELLLLSDGRVAYSGPAKRAVAHFEQLGFPKSPNHSIPDYLLDLVVGASKRKSSTASSCGTSSVVYTSRTRSRPNSLVDRRGSDQALLPASSSTDSLTDDSDYSIIMRAAQSSNTNVQSLSPRNDSILKGSSASKLVLVGLTGKSAKYATSDGGYMTSFYKQFFVLAARSFKNFVRNFFLFPAHLIFAVFMGLFMGFVFYQMPMDLHGTQDRIGSLFFICVVLSFVAMSSLELFVSEREVFVTERASGYYRAYAYYVSRMVFDILPLRTIPPIVIGSISYYIMGLRQDSVTHFFWFLLFLVLFNISMGGICLCISSVVQSVTVGNIIFLAINLFTMLFGGFFVNNQQLPIPLRYLQYISPYKFSLEALLVNEMHGRVILFNPPSAEYTFQMRAEKILDIFGFSVDHFALDLGVMASLALTSALVAGLLLRFCVREKR